ncbi:MAG: stalk domain-containing protein [Lachnospirales bacterium]
MINKVKDSIIAILNIVIISISIVVLMPLNTTMIYANSNEISINIDGVNVDFEKYGTYPIIIDGTTYVPLRSLFEAFGAVEDEDKGNNILGETYSNNVNVYTFNLKVGDYDLETVLNIHERFQPQNSFFVVNYTKDGESALLGFPKYNIILQEGRTYLPIRGISEAFGYTVNWDATSNTVLIDTANPSSKGFEFVDTYILRTEIRNLKRALNIDDTVTTNSEAIKSKTMEELQLELDELKTKASELRNIEVGLETPSVTEVTVTDKNKEKIDEVVALINAYRVEAGVSEVVLNEEISAIAQTKVNDMLENKYFEYLSPTYGTVADMLKLYHIDFTAVGENIAKNENTVEDVMDYWTNSVLHKKNLENENYTDIGIGLGEDKLGNLYWVQIFVNYR